MNASTVKRTVVVSGIGLIGPGAGSVAEFWTMLHEVRVPRPERLTMIAGPGDYIGFPAGDVAGASASRLERLALSACAEAIADAGLSSVALCAAGVSFGTTHGSIDVFEGASSHGQRRPSHGLYGVAALIAAEYGCTGPNQVYSSACSASLTAIGLSAETIVDGRADVMIAGGAELCSRIGLSAFTRLGGMDSDRCRPFDADREGAVFGEGAAVLILESEDHFAARGGTDAYCSIDGFGWSCDAHHPTAPEPSGKQIIRAMQDALSRANASPASISCIVPHGTGTRLNDQVEALALFEMLGAKIHAVPVFPLKAFIGHGAGAAGAFGTIIGALICARRAVPAVVNCDCPEFDLHLPRQPLRLVNVDKVLVNGYAFGGNNASVIVGALP